MPSRCAGAESTKGGGEVVHYLARHGESRVAKAVIISAVPPLMVKTAADPGGLPKEVFDGFQAQLAANRGQFSRDALQKWGDELERILRPEVGAKDQPNTVSGNYS